LLATCSTKEARPALAYDFAFFYLSVALTESLSLA
jgi:hypothetical protein